MALAVPSSTARVTANAAAATTASITPPADSVLVAITNANSNTSTSVTNVVTNTGTALTWVRVAFANFSTGQPGGTFIDVAFCSVSQAKTITATTTNNNTTAGDKYTSVRVWVVTGADTTTWVGASNKGVSTTNNLTTPSFTTLGDSSLGFCGGTDWAAPSGSIVSSDMGANGDAFNVTGTLNGFSGWKNLSTLGSAATFNLDAPGSGAVQYTWASCEILAAASGAPTPPLLPPEMNRYRGLLSR